MKPKKKDPFLPIIYGLGLLFVLYLMLHAANVSEEVNLLIELEEIKRSDTIPQFLTRILDRLTYTPNDITFCDSTLKHLFIGLIGWFIVVAAIETSRKNYIRGKEYGTARWATQADISDLFAENLEAAEIKKAKKMKTFLGKWQAKKKAHKKCEENAMRLQKVRLDDLREEEDKKRLAGNSNKKLYQEEVKKIKQETKENLAIAKEKSWKPDVLKKELEEKIKEIDESSMHDDASREAKKKQAKTAYDEKLADFYNPDKQIAKIRQKYKDADMLLTKTERVSIYNYILNNNTVIMGGSGSGKTRGYVMPNLLQAHSSFVVTDPKGEILEKAGYFLETVKGYKIRVLNLDEKSESDGYNPFVYIHTERDGYEERVLTLIETIIVNTDGGEKKGGSDPFWPMAERLFLQSVFFFTAVGFVKEEQNMNTVLKLIGMLEIGEEEDLMQSDLDMFAKVFAEKFGEDHIGVQQYKEFRSKASGKTAKSIVISAVARLAPFRTSAVQRIFSFDSMALDMLGEEKTAIFVVVPPTDDTFNFIAGMLFTQMFQELQYCATQVHKHDGQRLPVPVRFILDEFANTCTIPNFVKILAYARSFGIGITAILQSLEQIKNMYEKEWGVIIDNCNTILYLGNIQHEDTLEYMSKLLGKGTFDKQTQGRSKGKGGSSSKNEDVVGRELMDAAEIRKLPKKECLLIVSGREPFRSEKYEYTSHKNYQFTSDGNKAYSYHYIPQKPPWEMAEEQRRIAEEKKLKPSKDATIERKPISITTDESKILTDLTKAMSQGRLGIPDDDELYDDDGSRGFSITDFLAEAMEKEQEEKAIQVSEEVRNLIEEAREKKIKIETDMLTIVQHMGRTFRNQVAVTDKEMADEDGTSSGEVKSQAADFFISDDFTEGMDSMDSLEDVFSSLAAEIEGNSLEGVTSLVDTVDFTKMKEMEVSID